MESLKKYTISKNSKISDALTSIDQNKIGAIFVVEDNKLLGVITDGDVRRMLLKGGSLDEEVAGVINTNCIYSHQSDTRESMLKLLDTKVNVLPVVDKDKMLIKVLTRKEFPLEKERGCVVRARSPVRISFGGGGTDLTYFFSDFGGAVVSTTIQIYAHAILKMLPEQKVIIRSHDLNLEVQENSVEDLKKHPPLDLIRSLLELIKPSFGFELIVYSDFPVGSGLGGSSAVLAAILGTFNELRADPLDNYQLAELVFQAERFVCDISGGWQDQYATVFGGVNFIEFCANENVVHPLRLTRQIELELEGNLIMCSTGKGHDSGEIHKDQREKVTSNTKIRDLARLNKELTYKIKTQLLRGNLSELGKLLHETWLLKKQFSDKISSEEIDNIYNIAYANGAIGGKLLGAGGGGFFLFYVEPPKRFGVVSALHSAGYETRSIQLDRDGLQAWKVKGDF